MSNKTNGDPCQDSIRATVTKLCESYIVTVPQRDHGDLRRSDSVTISNKFWEEDELPYPGDVVTLDEVALYSRGWRAKSAKLCTDSV